LTDAGIIRGNLSIHNRKCIAVVASRRRSNPEFCAERLIASSFSSQNALGYRDGGASMLTITI
jgi:hypothetical protein